MVFVMLMKENFTPKIKSDVIYHFKKECLLYRQSQARLSPLMAELWLNWMLMANDGTMLDVEAIFYYPYAVLWWGLWQCHCCQMLCGLEKVQFWSFLTTRHLSPWIHGKVYEAWVRSAMLHGSKTWGPNATALLQWLCHDPLDPWHQRQRWNTQLHYYRNLTLRILHWSFTVGDSDGMAMISGPRPLSNITQTFQFPALESKEGLMPPFHWVMICSLPWRPLPIWGPMLNRQQSAIMGKTMTFLYSDYAVITLDTL